MAAAGQIGRRASARGNPPSAAPEGIWPSWKWAASDFGTFDHVRSVILFSLLFFLGVHVVFSSFFISMLGISRGTYIGDYDGQNH